MLLPVIGAAHAAATSITGGEVVTPPAVAGLPGIVTIFSMPRLERSDGTHLRIGPGGGEMTMINTWENRSELWKSVVRRCLMLEDSRIGAKFIRLGGLRCEK